MGTTLFENIAVGVRIKRIAFVAVKVYAAALYAEKAQFRPKASNSCAADFAAGSKGMGNFLGGLCRCAEKSRVSLDHVLFVLARILYMVTLAKSYKTFARGALACENATPDTVTFKTLKLKPHRWMITEVPSLK